MSATILEFTLRAVDEASKKFEDVAKSTESMGQKVRTGLTVGTVAVLGFDAAAIGIGGHLIEAGEGASTADSRIQQIAKSMGLFGGQTKEVSDRLIDLAEKTSLSTGIDANQIKLTQAKLLTFKELAKSADTVGGAFDRANQAALDMQAAGFGDSAMNAVQLGKALEDPVKGLTALNRSGITFNATQKAQIAGMVKAGDTAGAQNAILKAIEKQVGGTAAATANGSDKMKAGWDQVQESLGKSLLPTFNKLVDFLDKNVFPAVKTFADWMGKNPALVQILVAVLAALTIGMVIATAVVWAMNAALFANPVTWIILGIVALIAVIVLLAMNWDTVVKWITKVWGGFIGWITDGIKGFQGWWNSVWDAIVGFFSRVFQTEVMIVQTIFHAFVNTLQTIGNGIAGWWNSIWSGIGSVFRNVWNGIASFGAGIWNGIVGFVRGGVNGVLHAINGIIDGINGVAALGKAIGINVRLNHIPYLADGGVVTGPTIAMIGEAGPEAVIPLSRAKGQGILGGGGNGGGGGNVTVHVNVPIGFIGSPSELSRAITTSVINGMRSGVTSKTELRTAIGA